MFDIGFPELVLIAIVGLLVIGPERLPEALRSMGLWLGRMRRSFTAVKAEIEKEIGMDEVRRQLHNEAIMDEMKRIETEVKNTAETARSTFNEGVQAAQVPEIDPNIDGNISDMVAAQNSIGGASSTEPAEDADTPLQARDATTEASESAMESDSAMQPDDRDHTDAGDEPEPSKQGPTDAAPAVESTEEAHKVTNG